MTEPWLDRQKLSDHYSCSVRTVANAMNEGMPYMIVFGRPKFQVSTVEPWLIENGYLTKPSGTATVTSDAASGGATDATARPHDQEVSPDGS